MDARTRRSKLRRIERGQVLFTWSRRGWLVVGPTAVLVAAAQPPRPIVTVTKRKGRTENVRVMRVVDQFCRSGVRYSTAVFTRMPRPT